MTDYNDMPSEDREVSALSLPPHSMEAEQSVLGGLRGGIRRRRYLLRFGLLRFFLFFLVFFLFFVAVGDGCVNHGTSAFYGQFAGGNDRGCGQIDCGTDDAAAQNEAGG